ncbi:Hypothetical protein OINT_2000690 [Brucella intermedia LMG 3301]|uniref:Uncharacterized protein n=1 Tax=Brucella intermedia LMG 3301 TaxID=641118 RepID=C4WKZ9_9HYPH|nr:Hypothetical protein OINT_2000690 [Brucella intermedia LMG 3301]
MEKPAQALIIQGKTPAPMGRGFAFLDRRASPMFG